MFILAPKRHIGPPTVADRLHGAVTAPIVIIGAAAVTATVVLLIRLAFGGSLWAQLELWPLTFSVVAGAVVVALVLGRRWIEALITVLLIVMIALVSSELAAPVFAAIKGNKGAVIIPVRP
jgi:hypothetical protein